MLMCALPNMLGGGESAEASTAAAVVVDVLPVADDDAGVGK